MDKHDFDSAGLSNSAFVETLRQNFGSPRKPPAPHYIDTTQAPEDYPDRSFEKHSLFSAMACGVVLPLIAVVFVFLHFSKSPF
jgi:hypothetical protein